MTWKFRTGAIQGKKKKYRKIYCIKDDKLKRTLIVKPGEVNKTKRMVKKWK